jgi:hypothetical protein
MSALFSIPLLWAQAQGPQAAAPALPISYQTLLRLYWFVLWSDPTMTAGGITGGILTWLKALGLVCLVCWVASWLLSGVKQRIVGIGHWFDFFGVLALILTPVTVMIRVLESVKRLPVYSIARVNVSTLLFVTMAVCYVIWAEVGLARTIRRLGRGMDMLVYLGIHLALGVGAAAGLYLYNAGFLQVVMEVVTQMPVRVQPGWREGLFYGVRIGVTYMGYVVLARIAVLVLIELIAIRGRRLHSIARLSIYEANRRMWAPWVVLSVFLLVLAFTHWFLQPPRVAEMGRLYVSTLSLLCSVLLTVMVTILTPLSIPTDIQQQTIYTVVSKPVRRLELIWGRMIGYMALVTFIVLIFGVISLAYFRRTIYSTIQETEQKAVQARQQGRMNDFKVLAEQADQLRTRMSARVPINGSLSFLDSRGTPHAMGIDVGSEQGSMREPRSHIEGATPSTAIWSFGAVPDPFTPKGRPPRILDRRIPVADFLTRNTIEWHLDRVYELRTQIEKDKSAKSQPKVPATKVAEYDATIARNQSELDRLSAEYESASKHADELKAQATQAAAAGDKTKADALRLEAAALSSKSITIEMTFNVYRTTKGKVGEPVYAEIQAFNPRTGREFEGDVFPIKEYYTNRVQIPASILAGSGGALRIEIRCLSPTQYLGMAESDLYILAESGNFGFNFMKGLFGVWLQAMVLTAIGVCAGTFLSWPVALLTTIAFFVAGQLAFAFLVDFSRQAILGGGPFESLIRILTHDNQMSELAPTAGVVLAKTFDSLVMPLMSMMVYLVPNFQALDVSNMVADGFMVSWHSIGVNTLLALAYALPFSFAGYLILKNREVAA